MRIATHVRPINAANRLGLDYRALAASFGWKGKITDAHVHLNDIAAARDYFAVADLFGVGRVWAQTPLEIVDALRGEFGDRIEFVAGPDYLARHKDETFGSDWLKRIETYHAKGARISKFWAAPRGRDIHASYFLNHPTRLEAMRFSHALGMAIMVHVADPDTWFATVYRDAHRYGTKASHYEPFVRLMDQYTDVPWLAAHMAGDPEHLDHLSDLLDRHPQLHLDTSATKWMVRELSKKPAEFRAFCRRHAGRIFFGTDIVAAAADMAMSADDRFDLYASRFWAMRTLIESDYDGPSPIVDPDLSLVDPTLPRESTATLRGAAIDPATLASLYHLAAQGFLDRTPKLPRL